MRLRHVLKEIETRHPEGMSGAELQVANEDLLPMSPEKRTWGWISFVSFWIADGFNLNTFTMSATLLTGGADLVAGLYLRHNWVHTGRSLCRTQRTAGCRIPHQVSSGGAHIVRYLWVILADHQPDRHGLHLVGCPGMARGRMCPCISTRNLALDR